MQAWCTKCVVIHCKHDCQLESFKFHSFMFNMYTFHTRTHNVMSHSLTCQIRIHTVHVQVQYMYLSMYVPCTLTPHIRTHDTLIIVSHTLTCTHIPPTLTCHTPSHAHTCIYTCMCHSLSHATHPHTAIPRCGVWCCVQERLPGCHG